jgi:hypothetical protein
MSDTIEVERRNSITIEKKNKLKGIKGDGEWRVVVKHYYDGDISEAKRLLKEYNDNDIVESPYDPDKNKPTTFSSTV